MFEKGIAEQQLNDLYGHVIFTGEYYLKGHYLRKERCKTLSKIQFSTIKEPVYITPDEIFETFVEVDDNLLISKENLQFNNISCKIGRNGFWVHFVLLFYIQMFLLVRIIFHLNCSFLLNIHLSENSNKIESIIVCIDPSLGEYFHNRSFYSNKLEKE